MKWQMKATEISETTVIIVIVYSTESFLDLAYSL